MSIQEVSPEELAKLFHHYQQVLSPEYGRQRNESAPRWQEVAQQERHRLVTAARLALLELETSAREREDNKRYFARPGEAEWGC